MNAPCSGDICMPAIGSSAFRDAARRRSLILTPLR
jgi:hypothetical protein